MQEKKVIYREGIEKTVKYEDYYFLVDMLLYLAENKPMQDFPLQRLAWVFSNNDEDIDLKRVERAKTVYPVIIVKVPNENGDYPRSHFVVLDGYCRVAKAMLNGRTKIKVRILTLKEILEAHLEPIEGSAFWKEIYK